MLASHPKCRHLSSDRPARRPRACFRDTCTDYRPLPAKPTSSPVRELQRPHVLRAAFCVTQESARTRNPAAGGPLHMRPSSGCNSLSLACGAPLPSSHRAKGMPSPVVNRILLQAVTPPVWRSLRHNLSMPTRIARTPGKAPPAFAILWRLRRTSRDDKPLSIEICFDIEGALSARSIRRAPPASCPDRILMNSSHAPHHQLPSVT